ncbi:branched-chain amino acid ABC transporter permease [Roseibium aquae]|uniref:Branched-chain amino acid ABC transporter permease n=1 Tax=Roseibium aquae TaxID=1323746 RepID=A0A916T8Q8_9HYPH|nr:urea ABC transporter permease subunit UrtB [Roseibium aquae]GGB34453.1 branched-chain amino acid ABC transporter permease [Roseibium aquae]
MRLLILCLLSASIFLTIRQPVALANDLQPVLQENASVIERPSRQTAGIAIEALFASGAAGVTHFLAQWRDKQVWRTKEDGIFYFGPDARGDIELVDIDTGESAGTVSSRDLVQVKPNSGVRAVIDAALVRFQLSDPDPTVRAVALDTLERSADASQLIPLRASIQEETDPDLRSRKERLEGLLIISYGQSAEERIAAMERFKGDTGIDVRAAINPLLATRLEVAKSLPGDKNVARTLVPGRDIDLDVAYAMLVDADFAPAPVTRADRNAALVSHAADGRIGAILLETLNTEAARDAAYQSLAETGKVPPTVGAEERGSLLANHVFYEVYAEPDRAVTAAAVGTLNSINRAVDLNQLADLALDALSLASIYFLAAIGLAITFGVMGVINMAHGEFIMMGAYTGYVVQQFISNYTVSILVALPLAFAVTFAAGVLLERLVIRHLMHRPLETLLATFGVSIALQQLAKNIFGTQARPLTAPEWLDGSLAFNDIVSISYIRIAIFVLAVIFFLLLLFILKRTRLGLEVRAVTQNPSMASSMGINPDRINMLTFGLGSGIAGIAGVAIGLFAQVTSELGANYIVQSFMTVVVGGVGNIWGTLAGAGMIGSLQKIIEWFNPSNTLAAQTYMIMFVIIFIQFRPKGIIALKGRAAGD